MNLYTTKHLSATGFCVLIFLLVLNCSCSSCNNGQGNEDSTNPDEYHADNDIAMIVKSMADALVMGESLDTLEYNFEGVLTDGEGHPLYTDIQGSPGVWEIDIITPKTAVIRNLYLGDLLPDYLESYITQNLNLDNRHTIETSEFDDDNETQLVAYDLNGGFLRFETRAAVAPNGLEGPLLSIILTDTPPAK